MRGVDRGSRKRRRHAQRLEQAAKFIWNLYARSAWKPSNLYATSASCCATQHACPHAATLSLTGEITMLDVIYILLGAVFLGACILYAKACDHM